VGWVGLGQLIGGLGLVWVNEMDPRTTLRYKTTQNIETTTTTITTILWPSGLCLGLSGWASTRKVKQI